MKNMRISIADIDNEIIEIGGKISELILQGNKSEIGVDSNLATAIRTVVVVIMAWGTVFMTHAQSGKADCRLKSRGVKRIYCFCNRDLYYIDALDINRRNMVV